MYKPSFLAWSQITINKNTIQDVHDIRTHIHSSNVANQLKILLLILCQYSVYIASWSNKHSNA